MTDSLLLATIICPLFNDLGIYRGGGDAASVVTPLPLCKPWQRNTNWRKHLLLHSFVLRIPHVNRRQLIPAVLVDLLHMVTPLPMHNGQRIPRPWNKVLTSLCVGWFSRSPIASFNGFAHSLCTNASPLCHWPILLATLKEKKHNMAVALITVYTDNWSCIVVLSWLWHGTWRFKTRT